MRFYFGVDPVRILHGVLLEISSDDAMTTGTDGTKLCLSYVAEIMKQLNNPTERDKEFALWLIESLEATIKEGEDRTKMWKQFFCIALFCRILLEMATVSGTTGVNRRATVLSACYVSFI